MKNILYFTADWCNPCKKVKPIVNELIKDGHFFQIVDADMELELVKRFEIRSIPTFILLKDGVEIKRINGAQTKIELIDFINFVI